jgi:hypothetical protein
MSIQLLSMEERFDHNPYPIMGAFPVAYTKKTPTHLATPSHFGYHDTKYHGLLFLNRNAQPSFHTLDAIAGQNVHCLPCIANAI